MTLTPETIAELRAAIELGKQMGATGTSRHNIYVLAEKAADDIERYRKALEPFAKAVEEWGDDQRQPDRWNVWEHPIATGVTLGHFRAARQALGGEHDR